MNYLKKFESKEETDYSSDIKEIQSVLIDLKDEYPYIDGDIYVPKLEGEPFDIILECKNVIKVPRRTDEDGKRFTLEYCKQKSDFINFLLKIIERLESVMHLKASIINLWDWDNWQDTKITISLY